MFDSTYTPFQFMPLGYFTLLSIKWLCDHLSTKHVWKYRSGFISFSSCFLIHSALFFNPSKLYKMKLRSVFKNKPGNLTEVNILQWHKVHSGMITSEERTYKPILSDEIATLSERYLLSFYSYLTEWHTYLCCVYNDEEIV